MINRSSPLADGHTPPRPDYMVKLGLLPPYALEDVKRAYLEKVRRVHPDRGGTPAAFDALEQAYQQALEHVRFQSDRRSWIAAHMDEYVAQERCVRALEELGATVRSEEVDWLKRSLGDFSAMTAYVIGVRASDHPDPTALIGQLLHHLPALQRLKMLDLSGCRINDDAVFELRLLRSLVSLNLSRTPITKQALGIVHWLPALQRLDLQGTDISWWQQSKAQRFLKRRVQAAGAIDVAVHPVNVR